MTLVIKKIENDTTIETNPASDTAVLQRDGWRSRRQIVSKMLIGQTIKRCRLAKRRRCCCVVCQLVVVVVKLEVQNGD